MVAEVKCANENNVIQGGLTFHTKRSGFNRKDFLAVKGESVAVESTQFSHSGGSFRYPRWVRTNIMFTSNPVSLFWPLNKFVMAANMQFI